MRKLLKLRRLKFTPLEFETFDDVDSLFSTMG